MVKSSRFCPNTSAAREWDVAGLPIADALAFCRNARAEIHAHGGPAALSFSEADMAALDSLIADLESRIARA